MFSGTALRRDSASSICAAIDLLSQPRAILSFYAHAAPMESAPQRMDRATRSTSAINRSVFSPYILRISAAV